MFDTLARSPRTSRAGDAHLLAQAEAVGPGVAAMGLLEQVDPWRLNGHDRVRFVTAWQVQTAWVTARSYAALLPVVGPDPLPDPDPADGGVESSVFETREESVHAEVAAACRLSTVAASDRIATARFLAGPGAAVAGLLESGTWTYSHLRVVQSETDQLDEDLATRVIEVVTGATRPGVDGEPSRYSSEPPGRLRHRVRRTIVALDAEAAARRIETRRRERSCRISPAPDFRATLRVEGPHEMLAWAYRQFDAWARSRQTLLKDPGTDLDGLLGSCTCRSRGGVDDEAAPGHRPEQHPGSDAHDASCPRHPDTSLEALRADAVVAAARLLAASLGDPSGVEPVRSRGRSWSQAVVVVEAPTLLGLGDQPGWVPGYGWVPAPIARQLAATADSWRRFLTDAGRLVATGTTGYRPSRRLRELVTARDTSCTFPGCTVPSSHTDLDHAANFDGSNTTAANLHPACRRHHRIKTHGTWHAAAHPVTGRMVWTSATGHTYPQPPDPLWNHDPLWDHDPPGDPGDPPSRRPLPAPHPDSPVEAWTAALLAA